MKVIMNLDLMIAMEMTKDLTKRWSVQALAKAIDKHYRPVYAAVKRLIGEQVLQKDQNGLIVPVLKNTLHFETAEKKRVTIHKNKTIKIIKNKLENIENSFFSAVLFGSSVYSQGKDIDILIIIPDMNDIESFRNECIKNLGSFYSKLDLNIVNEKSCYEMLNKPNEFNVMNEIMKNHLVLIGTENFYRILKRWKNVK